MITLGNPFTSHAVLQRNHKLPVWGVVEPGEKVSVDFNGSHAECTADTEGKFRLDLPPMSEGGPYTMTVCAGEDRKVLTDLLIGVVFVCSGQSNMEYELKHTLEQEAEFYRDNTEPQKLRLYQSNSISWVYSTPDQAKDFSAAALHFGLKLYHELQIPVGLIVNAIGGTFVRDWTLPDDEESRRVLKKYQDCLPQRLTSEVKAKFLRNDHAGWQKFTVPGVFCTNESLHGTMWFRKKIELPERWKNRKLCFHSGGMDKTDVTFWNGIEIGATGIGFDNWSWNVKRCYEIPGELIKDGQNELAIRIFSAVYNGGFGGQAEEYFLAPADDENDRLELAGEWENAPEKMFDVIFSAHTPGALMDAYIRPLIPYAIDGVIWYQGENDGDSKNPDDTQDSIPSKKSSLAYEKGICRMIRQWREEWGQGDFLFLQTQISDYGNPALYEDCGMAYLRESQYHAAKITPFSDIAVTFGTALGECHAANKKPVGERLANLALHHLYGKDVPCYGPEFTRMTVDGNEITLDFTGAKELHFRKGAGTSFFAAGADRVFRPAEAEIRGTQILLHCRETVNPCAVRYAWANYGTGDLLFNEHDLPCPPFRTDIW